MDNTKETRVGRKRLASLAEGNNYVHLKILTTDPFIDNDYSKTIAGLEEDVVRDKGSRRRDAAAAAAAE